MKARKNYDIYELNRSGAQNAYQQEVFEKRLEFNKYNEENGVTLYNFESNTSTIYEGDELIETIVYVRRTREEIGIREEIGSNLWGLEQINANGNVYFIPIRDLKIGENCYDEDANYLGYSSR